MVCALAGIPLAALAQTNSSGSQLRESLSVLEQWVQTRQLISQERTEWETRRQSMQDLMNVYRQELEALDEQIRTASQAASAADEQRSELVQARDDLSAVARQIEQFIIELEVDLSALVKRLPAPAIAEVRPLVDRMPDNPRDTNLSLSQRMQNIVGILNQVDKFNSGVHLVSDQRRFDDGSLVQVQTIYFGLAGAYYADESGQHAGYARITENGWEWAEDNDLAPRILSAIRMYQGVTPKIEFVPLPVNVK